MNFVAFVERLEQTGEKNFWGYIRTRDIEELSSITDLSDVSPDTIRSLAEKTHYSNADLEAGYRAICSKLHVKPGWSARIYP